MEEEHHNRVLQRLVLHGVPQNYLHYQGIVAFSMENNTRIPGLVLSIFPTHEEMPEEEDFQECLTWLKWLMFQNDPDDSLSKFALGQRANCGAVWCDDDMAYTCNTCAVDLTSAICVSCFQNGDHSGHDYEFCVSLYRAGYCDCGDVTKWNPEGFCSEHKGIVQPLGDDTVANSVVPVLDTLFELWQKNLSDAILEDFEDHHYANDLSGAVIDMLLQISKHSGTLQSLISKHMLASTGLLKFLIKSERFLGKKVVKKLHELLLDLLGQHSFKYEFAKEFIMYYPSVINEIIEKEDDRLFRTYPLLSKFSMQIFPTPTLTPCLVEEHNLLATLFVCLENIFIASAGEGGRLETAKWRNFYDITTRVVEDIQLVISHVDVPQCMVRDLLRTWFSLLSFLQGINPIKRDITTNAIATKYVDAPPFEVAVSINNINSRLVGGAFGVSFTDEEILFEHDIDDSNDLRHRNKVQVSEPAICLTYECLRAISNWLRFYDSTSTEIQSQQHFNLGVLNLVEWPDIEYDVSTQEISVHSPLHCLLSMILHNALKRHSNADIFEILLVGCRPQGFSASIMEHALRVRVFCAQFCAGMWSQDDYTTMFSAVWYLNAHWSRGLESDLFLLQFCAAFSPPDLYVKRIIGRFGLSEYLSLNLETSSEYEPGLVKEMLTLLIQVLQERRFCGLTIPQSLKLALVCKLASGNATYSQLRDSLPCDLLECNRFQEILDTVASHSDPTELTERKYSLRSTCWKELDLYHIIWNFKDVEVEAAEERYTRFCGVSPQCAQVPRWTYIFPPLQGISRIATCKTMLKIIRAVLFYAVSGDKSTNSRASDRIVITSLHLLSLSLDIFPKQREQGPLIAFFNKEIGDKYGNGAAGHSLLSLLVLFLGRHKKENLDNSVISSLIESLVNKFCHIDSSCIMKLHQLAPELACHDANAAESTSESDRRKAEARERQANIMEKMKAEQCKFLSSIDISEVDEANSGAEASDTKESTSSQVVCSLCHDSNSSPISFLILLKKSKLLSIINRGCPSWDKDQVTDREEVSVTETDPSSSDSSTSNTESQCTSNDSAFADFENDIYASFWKEIHTKMLDDDDKLAVDEINQDDTLVITENADISYYDSFSPIDCDGIYVTSCGHAIHQECLDQYFSLNGKQSVSHQGNFFCPVCHILANSILPALPGDFHKVEKQSIEESSNSIRVRQGVLLLQFVSTRINTNNDISKAVVFQRNTEAMPYLEHVTERLSQMYLPRNARLSPSVFFWDALRYSIMSMEVVARGRRTLETPSNSLTAFTRQVQSRNGFVLSLLVKVVKNYLENNRNSSIHRLRGLELFSASICSGVSLHDTSGQQGGEIWNWTCDPVLTSDPFTSFMWVLFCAPSPFMACKESFTCLLHIFYVVSLVQGIIAYSENGEFKTAEAGHSIVDKVLEIFELAEQQHFVSNYAKIRESSFPYLRRCALLWKLLSSSIPAPYSDVDSIQSIENEPKEIQEVETMFKITSIDSILKDEMVRSLVLKWIRHFEKARSFKKCALYSSPTLPFQLMQLPYIFQHLYNRYAKHGCPTCKEDFFHPALCLLCGRLCCLYGSTFCQCRESKCEDHAMSCGAGLGAFLLIISSRIRLLGCSTGASWPSPYLDATGEEDDLLLRRRPLFLNEERYAALAYMVASHGLYRSSQST